MVMFKFEVRKVNQAFLVLSSVADNETIHTGGLANMTLIQHPAVSS